MRVIVYVEGPSDRLGLERLLTPLVAQAKDKGVGVEIRDLGGKRNVYHRGVKRAVSILRNPPYSHVFLVPDLHPRNLPFPHETAEDLAAGFRDHFAEKSRNLGPVGVDLARRFHAHCFKHDFEALLLACPDLIRSRLDLGSLGQNWTKPVEDHDLEDPPKRVVERLFRDAGQSYKATVDAPSILEQASLDAVLEACPQCFAPFVDDLKNAIADAARHTAS